METDTPRTDSGCAPIYFGNGTSTIAADPDISRQLERELTQANAKIKELTFGWAADREEIQIANGRIAELEKKLKCQESAASFWQNYGASEE